MLGARASQVPRRVRQAVRQARAGPGLEGLRQWLDATLRRVPRRSDLAAAIRYTRSRRDQLCRYRDDGRLEIDNSAAERALRGVALGRKNWLFAGSDAGGQRAAAIYSLVETCTLNAVNPKPTCATCSASSQIIPSIASPSSYLGTLVTSLPGPKNSGPPADAYGSTGAQVVSTP